MTVKIKRILVPIDYSENARIAKDFADTQARLFEAEVNLLHVVDESGFYVYAQKGIVGEEAVFINFNDSPPGSEMESKINEFMAKAKAELHKFANGAHGNYKTTMRQGNTVDEILAEIDEYKPDLVVMCTHGWTGVKHMMLGSVTEKIVRLSPVPVLTTRGKEA